MKLGIMQPYFFPYIGYFQLIDLADKFILFDDVQYIRHGWINRNRILKPNEGWQYVIAPLAKHNQTDLIRDIHVKTDEDWSGKIFRQLEHYKKKSPYYNQTIEVLKESLKMSSPTITGLNKNTLLTVCNYLGIQANIEISSDAGYDYTDVSDAGEWALAISKQNNAAEYINPPGGIELFDREKFLKSNIELTFLKPILKEYNQRRNGVFEAGLSIIDVMMFNSAAEIKDMLKEYETV